MGMWTTRRGSSRVGGRGRGFGHTSLASDEGPRSYLLIRFDDFDFDFGQRQCRFLLQSICRPTHVGCPSICTWVGNQWVLRASRDMFFPLSFLVGVGRSSGGTNSALDVTSLLVVWIVGRGENHLGWVSGLRFGN